MALIEYRSKPSALAYMAKALLPKQRPRGLPVRRPDLVVRWRGVRAAAKDIDDAGSLAEERSSQWLPFLYFDIVGFRLQMALLTQPAFPVPMWRMLQVRNRLVQHRALRRDAAVDLELRVAALRILGKGLEADVHMTVTESSSLAWECVNTFYARGSFGAADAAAAQSISAPEAAPLAQWTAAASGALRFARLTGDYNPLHLADGYARRRGFPRAFLHPQRVLGECLARLPQLAGRTPGLLDAWIKGPVPYGAPVRLAASDEEGGCRFALWTEFDPRPALVGRVKAAA